MNVNVTYSGYTLADAASCVMMRLPVPDLVWDMEALWKVWNEPLPAVDVPEAAPTDAQEEAEPVNQEAAKAVIAELEEHIRRQMPSRAKPVTYNGVTYPSLTACAKAFGLTVSACSRRLRKGQPLDKKLKAGGRPLVPVTVNGTEYPSMAAAAKALGVPYQTLCSRIRKGQDLSAPKYADRCKPIVYQGNEYPSIEALARATGINSQSWLYRIRHNIPLDAPWGKGSRKRKAEPVKTDEPVPEPGIAEAVRQAVAALPPAEPKPNRYADEGNGRRLKNCPCELDGRQYTSLDTAAVILDLTLGEAYRQVMKRGKFLKKGVK